MSPFSRKELSVTSLLFLETACISISSPMFYLNASDCVDTTTWSIELLSSCGVRDPNLLASLGLPALCLKRKQNAVTLRRLVRCEKDFTRSKSSVAVVIAWQKMSLSLGRPCEPIIGDWSQCEKSFVNQCGLSHHKLDSRSCHRVVSLDTKSAGLS